MNKRHYEHTLPNIRGSLSNTYLLKRIEEQTPNVRPVSFSFPQCRTEPSFQHLEVRDLTHPALLRYLQGRGINIELAKRECKELHFTNNGKPFFAIGFPNMAGGYEVRNSFFKRLYCPERYHPYTAAGRAEREVSGIRGIHGLPLFPYAPHEELSDHA